MIVLVVAFAMIFSLCACSKKPAEPAQEGNQDINVGPTVGDYAEPATITVFAPSSAVLFLMTAIDKYSVKRPDITVTANFDSSLVNTEKVMSGYRCDMLVAEDPAVLDFIDAASGKDANPYELDLIVAGSRRALCTAEDAESGAELSFSAAVLKQTAAPYETQLFIDFLADCGDDVYADLGFTKAE